VPTYHAKTQLTTLRDVTTESPALRKNCSSRMIPPFMQNGTTKPLLFWSSAAPLYVRAEHPRWIGVRHFATGQSFLFSKILFVREFVTEFTDHRGRTPRGQGTSATSAHFSFFFSDDENRLSPTLPVDNEGFITFQPRLKVFLLRGILFRMQSHTHIRVSELVSPCSNAQTQFVFLFRLCNKPIPLSRSCGLGPGSDSPPAIG
jgi:hypothetical protein